MSSRALRKAQKQKEEQAALEALRAEAEELESSEEEEAAPPPPRKSAFALLDEVDVQDDDSNADDASDVPTRDASHTDEEPTQVGNAQKLPKRKKKKKPKKSTAPVAVADGEADDIDAALAALQMSKTKPETEQSTVIDTRLEQFCALLAVDQRNLHAENEMKRLFGRAAMGNDDEQAAGAGRRRNNQQRMAGLAGALGRQPGAPGGRSSGLGLLGLRRNPFISGKEEWPIGTSGGLGMEIIHKNEDGIVEYKFVHNRAYQDVQSEFEVCVRGMDPERMVRLLQLNPYHISTLLQVSEIAKQERDHSTSGDLLERALFTFGRSLHSTFANNLTQGKARLDFRRPENREFWLAVSRYITNLTMRATWRTVLEWAKLLLALDPVNDPYQMRLVIDQYAMRAKQVRWLVDLNALMDGEWQKLPNLKFSVGLALVEDGQGSKGKQTLFSAANRTPWVATRLFQELNLDPPPGIWGKTPRTDREKLHAELYATRAKDIWSSPEATALLEEVCAAVVPGSFPSSSDPPLPADDDTISLAEGRHVLLTEQPALIALLPRALSARLTSISDPLPPDDNLASYTTSSAPSIPSNVMSSRDVQDADTTDPITRVLQMIWPAVAAADESDRPAMMRMVQRANQDAGFNPGLTDLVRDFARGHGIDLAPLEGEGDEDDEAEEESDDEEADGEGHDTQNRHNGQQQG